MLSRKTLFAAMSALAASQPVSAAIGSTTSEIVVGPGCDFEHLAPALASLTDNSKDNPYVIKAMPGIYNLRWETKSWVTVVAGK